MKIRSLLTILAMFSVLLLGAGTAHAVYGVADDVPAQDLIIPIICGKDANNGVNTAIAIAEVTCGSLIDPPIVGWPNVLRRLRCSDACIPDRVQSKERLH